MARPKIESKTFKLAGKEFTVKVDGEGAAFFCGDKWICDIEQRKKIDEDSLKGLIRMTEPLLKMSMGIQQRGSKKETTIKFNTEKRHRRTKAEIEQDKLKPKKRVRRTKAQIEADKLKAQSKPKRKPRSDKGKPRVRKAV